MCTRVPVLKSLEEGGRRQPRPWLKFPIWLNRKEGVGGQVDEAVRARLRRGPSPTLRAATGAGNPRIRRAQRAFGLERRPDVRSLS